MTQPVQCIGGMATMPSRAHTLGIALANILPQVDRLFVYLDQHTDIPVALTQNEKIVPILPGPSGDFRGNGKFLGLELHAGPCLYFCFDDDILYPPNHVEVLTRALFRHTFQAIVGFHGNVFEPPHLSYRQNRFRLHFNAGLKLDCHVDELGSGTIAFHSESIHLHFRKWRYHDMTDLMIAIEAVQQEVPRIAVQRPENFLLPLEQFQSDSLYKKLLQDDARETSIMREAIAAYPLYWQNCLRLDRGSTAPTLGFLD